MIYSKPPGYAARGLSFATFVIPTFAAFGAYEIAGIAGIKFRWRERWAPADIERLDRWRENLRNQDRLNLLMYMNSARFAATVALVACAGVSFAILWSFAAEQSRLHQKHDQVVRELLRRPARTGLYRKNKVHFGDHEPEGFFEWKSNGRVLGHKGERIEASNQAKQDAILDHLHSPGVREVAGTYRGFPAKHIVDPLTRRSVVLVERGDVAEFVDGLELSSDQLQTLLKTGELLNP